MDLEGFILLLLMSQPIKHRDPAAKLEPFTVTISPFLFFMYSFLMKISPLIMQFLTSGDLTLCVPLNQSQENVESGIMCWCILYRNCNRDLRPY